jgi:hypothetical protein
MTGSITRPIPKEPIPVLEGVGETIMTIRYDLMRSIGGYVVHRISVGRDGVERSSFTDVHGPLTLPSLRRVHLTPFCDAEDN